MTSPSVVICRRCCRVKLLYPIGDWALSFSALAATVTPCSLPWANQLPSSLIFAAIHRVSLGELKYLEY